MKRSALFVGVNRYNDPSINNLNYAESDATELYAFFKHRAGYDDVRHLTAPDSDELLDAAKEMATRLGPGDLFLFFFAGHGVEYEGRHLLLCPKAQYSRLKYLQNAVPVDLIKEETSVSGLNRVLMLDACRTDLLRGNRSGSMGMRDVKCLREMAGSSYSGEGSLAIVCSCDEGQQSQEVPQLRQGVFSLALLMTLEERLEVGGRFDLTEAVEELLPRRMRDLAMEYGYPPVQRPWIQKSGSVPSILEPNREPKSGQLGTGHSIQTDRALKKDRSDGYALLLEPVNSLIITEDRKSGATDLTIDIGGGVRMESVLIPVGEFMMGSNDGANDEKPVHKVKISKPFYMCKYQVTQEQYEKVMGTNPSHFKGAKNPVESVSWNDAQEFCKRLSQTTGYAITLPTEAQWEYACRAGTTTEWHFGDNESQLGEYAWYSRNSGDRPLTGDWDINEVLKKKCRPHPVGQKKPNAWGLYDMHGNMWEWCQDWYDSGYYGKSPASDPMGPTTGSFRVIRGGGCGHGAALCRSAYRSWYDPDYRGSVIGFRVVAVRRD